MLLKLKIMTVLFLFPLASFALDLPGVSGQIRIPPDLEVTKASLLFEIREVYWSPQNPPVPSTKIIKAFKQDIGTDGRYNFGPIKSLRESGGWMYVYLVLESKRLNKTITLQITNGIITAKNVNKPPYYDHYLSPLNFANKVREADQIRLFKKEPRTIYTKNRESFNDFALRKMAEAGISNANRLRWRLTVRDVPSVTAGQTKIGVLGLLNTGIEPHCHGRTSQGTDNMLCLATNLERKGHNLTKNAVSYKYDAFGKEISPAITWDFGKNLHHKKIVEISSNLFAFLHSNNQPIRSTYDYDIVIQIDLYKGTHPVSDHLGYIQLNVNQSSQHIELDKIEKISLQGQ